MSPTSPAPVDDPVLRVGDRIKIHLDLARWVGTRPTRTLVIASLTRTTDGTVILGLHFPPAEDGAQTENPERRAR